MDATRGYRPIADYALIGNRHTSALVASDGSIDWCCLPYLESPSVFGRLLDARRAGWWRVAPAGGARARRAYHGNSAVLETTFRGAGGVLRLRDFLPVRADAGPARSRSTPVVVRTAECLEGSVTVEVEWVPRPSYGRADVGVVLEGEVAVGRSPAGDLWLAGIPAGARASTEGAALRCTVALRAGERLDLVSGPGAAPAEPAAALVRRYLAETLAWWEAWCASCDLPEEVEPWRGPVLRSGMVLKVLASERSGAIAAAPTTSIPEEIGGVRNWDYRYCWVRDSSMIAQALLALGERGDGTAFLAFLEEAAQQHHDPARVQVLYGLSGERHLPEYVLGHLDGYRDSRPVRIGNAAAIQRQIDVYGELIEAAYDLLRLGAPVPPEQWEWLRRIADYVCMVWRWADRGIWEVRGPERHFTYSKLMCWVALDRALRIGRALGRREGEARWMRERAAIRAAILTEGFDRGRNSFVQSFGSDALDASTLLIPLMGLLPARDPRVQGTIDAVLRELTEDGLVHRYLPEAASDGVEGGEGAFGLCTFWLSQALALSGRVDESRELFESMLARANDVGLYSEEIDPATGEFLGNFPQAFTHVGLINSAYRLGGALLAREEPGRPSRRTTASPRRAARSSAPGPEPDREAG